MNSGVALTTGFAIPLTATTRAALLPQVAQLDSAADLKSSTAYESYAKVVRREEDEITKPHFMVEVFEDDGSQSFANGPVGWTRIAFNFNGYPLFSVVNTTYGPKAGWSSDQLIRFADQVIVEMSTRR